MSRLIYAIAYTKNLDSMCEFYRDQVGLRIRRQEPQWVELDTGGAILALHETRDEGQEGLALRFETDDLEAYQRALAARGVPPRVPVEAPIGRLVDLRDSEGNRLQILEPHRPVPAGSGPAIERVILNVGDFTRAVSFYRGAMGCRVESEAPHWVEFDAGETLLAVHHRPSGGDHPRHAEQPIALVFGTDDLTLWSEEMRARGLRFVTAPVMDDFGVYAEAVDPDGRIAVFREPPPPATLEEELAEEFEDDEVPHRVAIRKPVKKGSATASLMAVKPTHETKRTPKRRRPSATTTRVASVRGAGPERTRLRPKKTGDEKKARVKPAIGRLRKAELRSVARHRTAVATVSKGRPVKRRAANAARRRGR